MKCSLALYVVILISLSGCQNLHVPRGHSVENVKKIDQLSQYGAKFASEYSGAAKETCTKYTQLYQEGDWRAGWILALQVTETKSQHCLSSEEAIQILTTLESEKKIHPELLWLSHVHLNWLGELEQQAKKVRHLKRIISRKQSKLTELEKENQDLLQKLEALKAIETSINQ